LIAQGKTILRYQTFIADEYVWDPPLCLNTPPILTITNWRFGGNNRTFTPVSADSKTVQQLVIDWDTASLRATKYVGPTNLYFALSPLGPYLLHSTKTAPSTGIYAEAYGPITNQALIHMHLEAANPYCPLVDPIFYDITGSVYPDETYLLSGTFQQVPNHEFYLRDGNDSSWTTIYQANIAFIIGFGCLTPLVVDCKRTDTWKSGTVYVYN
jgi:hypothetical protein